LGIRTWFKEVLIKTTLNEPPNSKPAVSGQQWVSQTPELPGFFLGGERRRASCLERNALRLSKIAT
jgi:hypothetical protein